MLIFFGILIVIAAVALAFVVLVQNPKGGGLNDSLGGIGNQLMGVKQTTDVLEKGTWILAALIALFSIISPAFTPKEGASKKGDAEKILNDVKETKPKADDKTAPLQKDTTK